MRAVVVATSLLVFACSTTKDAKKGDGDASDGSEKISENISRKRAGNEKVKPAVTESR